MARNLVLCGTLDSGSRQAQHPDRSKNRKSEKTPSEHWGSLEGALRQSHLMFRHPLRRRPDLVVHVLAACRTSLSVLRASCVGALSSYSILDASNGGFAAVLLPSGFACAGLRSFLGFRSRARALSPSPLPLHIFPLWPGGPPSAAQPSFAQGIMG